MKRLSGESTQHEVLTATQAIRRVMLAVIDVHVSEMTTRRHRLFEHSMRISHFLPAIGELLLPARYSLNAFLNFVTAAKNVLTTAVSFATCKQFFSKLKLIKIALRTWMSQARLSDLAILSIERQRIDALKEDDVLNSFFSEVGPWERKFIFIVQLSTLLGDTNTCSLYHLLVGYRNTCTRYKNNEIFAFWWRPIILKCIYPYCILKS